MEYPFLLRDLKEQAKPALYKPLSMLQLNLRQWQVGLIITTMTTTLQMNIDVFLLKK